MTIGEIGGIDTRIGLNVNAAGADNNRRNGNGENFTQVLSGMIDGPLSFPNLPGLGDLGGTPIMPIMSPMSGMSPMGGMSGVAGTNPMLNGFLAPGIYEMQNGLLATANQGEMSGEHLMMFMMMMMMQTTSSGGDSSAALGPIMQMMAGLLSNTNSGPNVDTRTLSEMMVMPGFGEAGFGDARFGGDGSPTRRMVDIALSVVGYQERNRDGSIGRGNFTKFGAWYGMDGQPWCAMFVSWAADQAGILGSVVPRHAWTPSGVNAYRERGLYEERGSGYLPREGDAIFFFNPAKGRVAHVGIVVAFDPQTQRVYTVEGNTNNAVRIRYYDLSNPRIHGFGRNGGTSFGTVPITSTSGDGASLI